LLARDSGALVFTGAAADTWLEPTAAFVASSPAAYEEAAFTGTTTAPLLFLIGDGEGAAEVLVVA
jgi:hypothetical protein